MIDDGCIIDHDLINESTLFREVGWGRILEVVQGVAVAQLVCGNRTKIFPILFPQFWYVHGANLLYAKRRVPTTDP